MKNSEIILNVYHTEFYEQLASKVSINSKGVYILRKYNLDGDLMPIQRLISGDEEATLYIGKSDNLVKRLGVLVNLINGTSNTGKHSMGRRFQEIEILGKHLKPKNLKLHLTLTDNPRQLESKLLEEYLNKFGELPPLNNSR